MAGRNIRREALQLPVDERARLAADLLDSLEEAEEAVDTAWGTEIETRVAAIRAGEFGSTDWQAVSTTLIGKCSVVEARHDIECAASSEPLNNSVILRRRSTPQDLKIRNACKFEILRRRSLP
ncbi:MAG TPA: addiction module protein [Thermoanaerobaculia bacterium]